MAMLNLVLSASYLYVFGTIFFDIIHYLLHKWSRSRWRTLRFLSRCHQYHHLYYPRSLQFNQRYAKPNALIALPLELICQLLGSVVGWILATILSYNVKRLDSNALPLVLVVQTVRSLFVIISNGQDSNHIALDKVPKDHSWAFVGPEYHSLHHIYPDRYMGSMVKLFDWVAGTAYSLRNKTVVMTGGSGAFGQAMEKQLLAEGVKSIHKLRFGKDWNNGDFSRVGPILEGADIIILAHGTKGLDAMDSNCTSSVRFVELFLQKKSTQSQRTKVLPEIWYVGSEAELHPAWGGPEMVRYTASKRAFLPYARALYKSDKVIYRHIVPAAFDSRMGKAVVSADWAAQCTMSWIRRGAHYVPVTYTGLAYLNFFKFLFGASADPKWVDKIRKA
ncbi:hypothetical protein ASPBRDRAFT_35236 [Aspergillus brasiliensis CBS 101740]|uniref:Fatty acid hydroxylase domain-containing protein n=1 Tax=Aspergillus brasiliensis (strain CBS 101740 / IMI 381727 / IBT 21946) TaxID=767769 RepID=A0A1L9U3E5_ASPBC|nr:hypothetical protein ASPBRDRAFT_35236 [Aspergillus brasiliensis CBS 101740]